MTSETIDKKLTVLYDAVNVDNKIAWQFILAARYAVSEMPLPDGLKKDLIEYLGA
jgi:hypothetical protein